MFFILVIETHISSFLMCLELFECRRMLIPSSSFFFHALQRLSFHLNLLVHDRSHSGGGGGHFFEHHFWRRTFRSQWQMLWTLFLLRRRRGGGCHEFEEGPTGFIIIAVIVIVRWLRRHGRHDVALHDQRLLDHKGQQVSCLARFRKLVWREIYQRGEVRRFVSEELSS